MREEEFAKRIEEGIAEAQKHETCMALNVHDEGSAVELLLDTGVSTYSEWIPGEGGDIGLIRCQETKRAVGVRLPLYKKNLCIHHDGPIRINAGFRKTDTP